MRIKQEEIRKVPTVLTVGTEFFRMVFADCRITCFYFLKDSFGGVLLADRERYSQETAWKNEEGVVTGWPWRPDSHSQIH